MTPQEAIEFFKGELEGGKCSEHCVQCNANELALQALEKQIPKKVKKEQWIDSKCTCGYVFSKHHGDGYYSIPLENKTKYCPNCGQKIDFGE